MVVYVEVLFINNFTLLLFVQYLCGVLLRSKNIMFRLIFTSLTGSIIYIVSLYLNAYGFILLALIPFLLTALIANYSHAKDYLTAVFVFIALYFACIGSAVFVAYLANMEAVNIIYFLGNIPFYISVSFIVITFLICYIKRRLLSINITNSNIFDAEMVNGHFCCRTKAYYDTGNTVFTKNGERVVIVSEYIYNKLMPASNEDVKVATISSEYTMPVTPILLKIYFNDGVNKIYKVMAGKGKIDTDRYKIILHKDMR